MIGTCKLCHKNDVDLQDSHLIAQTFYRKIRRSEGANNSLVAISKDSVRFTDEQIHDYVLCAECEQRFGQVEDWVSRRCLQADGSFQLRDVLVAQARLGNDPEMHVVAGKAAQIGAEQYVYFAASILWRAGVHVWRGAGSGSVSVQLGLYKEQLRLYLLGQTPLPVDVAIGVIIAEKADTTDQFFTTPVLLDTKGYCHYEIVIPGIQFGIFVGQKMPNEARVACLLRSDDNLVFLTDHVEQRSMKGLLRTARVTKRVEREAALRRN